MRDIIIKWFIPGIAFLLPWQTRWIFGGAEIVGQPFEFGIYSLYAIELLIFLIFLALGRLQIRQEYRLSLWLAGLVLVVSALSFIVAENSILSLIQWMHLAVALLFFVILLDHRVSIKRVFTGFVLGLVIPSLVGIFQFFYGSSAASTILGIAERDAARLGDSVIEYQGGRFLRAYGSFSHPNIFGGYLAVALAGIIGFWDKLKTKATIILSGIVGFIISFAFILTFSRSAWLGLGLGLLVGTIILAFKNKARAKMIVVPLSLILIGLAVLGSAGRLNFSSSFESRSIEERIVQYQEFPVVIGREVILGQGIGNYTLAIADVFTDREWWQYQPIHNVLLLIMGEIGLIGLLCVILWAASIDKINFARFPERQAVTAFMMGNILLLIVFFDHYLWSNWSGLALVALVMAATLRLGEEY
ncbi:MAG: O-antigen ligase family protein [Patescibacteria group bacterium]